MEYILESHVLLSTDLRVMYYGVVVNSKLLKLLCYVYLK